MPDDLDGDPGDFGSDIGEETNHVLFEGDTGCLPLIGRKALVLLLKRTHVTAITHPREWQAILDHREKLDSRLNDLFLELVVDEAREVAYKRQAGRELGRMFTTLLHNRAYSKEEVAMLIQLRMVHQRALRDGTEVAYVERKELLDAARSVQLPDTKDLVRAEQAGTRALDKLTEDDFLLKDPSDPDRLRISPIIETLLTVERTQAFVDALYAVGADDETTEDEQ